MASAAVHGAILPGLRALTDRMGAIGEDLGATDPDVATAWAIAKGTTPIIGVTKAAYIDGWSELAAESSPARR